MYALMGGVSWPRFVRDAFLSSPYLRYFIEATVVMLIAYQLFLRKRQTKPKKSVMSEAEKDEAISRWKPAPLVPEYETPIEKTHKVVDGKMGAEVMIEGKKYKNLATSNFLCFVGNEKIETAAKAAVFKYGVGSCGPRAFYGTVDVHLDLETEVSKFIGCEESALYSYGFATAASAISAYAKRGDIIFADKGCNFAIQKGLQASRSKTEWFEHNNMDDLERLLKLQEEKERKDPKKARSVRKFIVVESLYEKTADLCPLRRLVELKWRYKVRIFVDESYSFGVLGATGRGLTEHLNVKVEDIDMIIVSLEHAIASTGGLCCGRSFVIGHQRLAGLGYCFSASLPPLLATAAREALSIVAAEPERVARLQANARQLHDILVAAFDNSSFVVQADPLSPMKHVYSTAADEAAALATLAQNLFDSGLLVAHTRYLEDAELFPVRKSLKINCNSEMTAADIDAYGEMIAVAARNCS